MVITTISVLLKQLLIIVPSIIASTTVITGTINAAFNIEQGDIKHLISWIVAVLCGVCAVLSGGLTLGFGWVDYVIGGLFGLISGGAANGLYDWPVVSKIIDSLYLLFGNGDTIKKKTK